MVGFELTSRENIELKKSMQCSDSNPRHWHILTILPNRILHLKNSIKIILDYINFKK